MVNQLKIITMTRLALYDKHEGPADRAANEYFRHDYIYRNNLGTRLAVGSGAIVILVIYWLQAFFINEMDLFELNFRQYATDSLMFILAVLAVYSLIGTIQGTRQYYLMQKRLAQYQALVRQLERLEERAQRVYDDEAVSQDTGPRGIRGNTSPNRYNTGPVARTSPPRPPVRTRPTPNTMPPVRTGVGPSLEGTRPPRPRPLPHGSTTPPRPVPPGYTRPNPPLPGRRPPRPPATSPEGARPPVDTPSPEHTKVPVRPANPEGS